MCGTSIFQEPGYPAGPGGFVTNFSGERRLLNVNAGLGRSALAGERNLVRAARTAGFGSYPPQSLIISVLLATALGACGGRVADDSVPIEFGASGGWSNTGSVVMAATGGAAVSLTGPASTGGANVLTGSAGTGGELGGASATGGTSASSGGTTVSCSDSATDPKALIDDMENASGRILEKDGRVGAWYAFGDGRGTQWPTPTTLGVPIQTSVIPDGRGCSTRALHSYGSGFDEWGAGIGFDLAFDGQKYSIYDASAYSGITFWAQGLPTTMMQIRVSTANTTHTEWGGSCEREPCPFPYHISLAFNATWTQHFIPFADLYQNSNNGQSSFEQSKLTNVQIYVPGNVDFDATPYFSVPQHFDFWVDDIAFYTDPPACCSALSACQGVIQFADSKFEQSVRTAIDRPTGNLTCQDACSIHIASLQGDNLNGIECMANLDMLLIAGNKQLSDLAPLANLVQLRALNVNRTGLSELGSLASLTNLVSLDLDFNSLFDLSPLSSLQKLTTLDLGYNQISDLSALSSLTKLTTLYLHNNQISDVSTLSSLTNLTKLDLGYNQISDVSALSSLMSLSAIYLKHNQISDVSALLALTGLKYIDLTSNPLCSNAQDSTVVALKRRGVWVNCSS